MSSITVSGNLVSTPEVRRTLTGNLMTTGTVVENTGYHDKHTNSWKETAPIFWPFVVWGDLGVNVAASLKKGDRVVVIGETRSNEWTDEETGKQRSRIELTAREVAASLRFAEARPIRQTRAEQPGTVAPAAAAEPDPWGNVAIP